MRTVWQIVKENATINKYPEEELNFYINQMKNYYSQIASLYGVDFGAFLASMQMDENSFDQECQNYARDIVKEQMILTEIARLENIVVNDEEYRAEIEKNLKGTDNTEEDLLQYYGGEEGFRETITFNKVFDFINSLKSTSHDSALIVGHSGVSKAFYAYFNGIPEDGRLLDKGLKNCEIKEYYL